MARTVMRSPVHGVWTVVRFNWHFHLIAAVLIAAACLAAVWSDGILRFILLSGAVSASLSLVLSLAATWIAYDAMGIHRFDWLVPYVGGVRRAANIHAGFDETTDLLRSAFPEAEWHVFDFYDPALHTEISIRRARRAHPPQTSTVAINTGSIPCENGSLEMVTLLLAAHEIRNHAERVNFFREIRRTLDLSGKVVVTEHLRDAFNMAAYSIGAWHFHTRTEWLSTFAESGFSVREEFRNNPFITTFILKPHETPA